MIPAYASSSRTFCMMYSAQKLNKQGDNIQPWCTRFPIWNQPVVPCPVITVASWPAYRFLRRQARWSGISISLTIFHSLLWSTQSRLYLAFLASMQTTYTKCWAGWITSWNQDCWGKYKKTQLCRWHQPYGRKRRQTKEPLDESERGEWKSWLKTQHSENLRSSHPVPSLHGK